MPPATLYKPNLVPLVHLTVTSKTSRQLPRATMANVLGNAFESKLARTPPRALCRLRLRVPVLFWGVPSSPGSQCLRVGLPLG